MAAKLTLPLIASLLLAGVGLAQEVTPGGPLAKRMGLDQRFGAVVPPDATFTDESGQSVQVRDILGKRPVVLLPMFFACEGVCRLELDGLFGTIEKDSKLELGKDFDVLMLSIHPKETSELASGKERQALAAYDQAEDNPGSHAWVGKEDQIRRVTDAVGFRYEYDERNNRINHPAGIIFLDKDGVVRGYMYGSHFDTVPFEKNLQAAAAGERGLEPELILLGCVMVDPVTGKKSLVIKNLLIVLGISTMLLLGGSILYMSRKYPTQPIDREGGNGTGD